MRRGADDRDADSERSSERDRDRCADDERAGDGSRTGVCSRGRPRIEVPSDGGSHGCCCCKAWRGLTAGERDRARTAGDTERRPPEEEGWLRWLCVLVDRLAERDRERPAAGRAGGPDSQRSDSRASYGILVSFSKLITSRSVGDGGRRVAGDRDRDRCGVRVRVLLPPPTLIVDGVGYGDG